MQYQCQTVAIPVFSDVETDFPYEEALQIVYDTCRYFLAEKQITMDIFLVLYGDWLNDKHIGVSAVAAFNTVSEYVKTQYRMDEKTKENLQIAQTVEPYFAEKSYQREITMPDGRKLTIIPRRTKVHFSISSVSKSQKNIPDKEEFVPDDSFTKKLMRYMEEKKMAAPLVYSKAGYDRKLFSKIQSDLHYHPRKYTIVRFALALQLDLQETNDLLNAAGFALSRSLIIDLVISYCIEHNMRSVWEVNNLLESYGLELI